MKCLVLGAGGIGSFLVDEICKCIEHEQIDPNIEFYLADNDLVEPAQIAYQKFTYREVGVNKAQALADRYKMFGIKPIRDRIKTAKQLKGYDFIILCVDNNPTRELVIKHCFEKGVDFIDLRASGRIISAFPKLGRREENLNFVDSEDTACYSCQDKGSGRIDKGNKIIALIGVQMFLNCLRGMNNKIISLAI